ncbi:MAG: hypothetical protein IJU44_01730 [Kiritimatiellae bacterium]|nr:hypothetical protein [Kiritimatiellia bacterium]
MSFRNRLIILILLTTAFFAQLFSFGEESVFDMPKKQERHRQLQIQLIKAAKSGDYAKIEEVSRQGCELLPHDPMWRYNLACALAYRKNKDAAFEALEQAVDLGFVNRDMLTKDQDIQQLSGDPRYALILKKIKAVAANPPPNINRAQKSESFAGYPVEINGSNTVWNFDTSCFQTTFKIVRPLVASEIKATADRYCGPAAEKIRGWIKDGSAASNVGDIYVNRDDGHSRIAVTNFPWLTPVVFGPEAKKAGEHVSLPNMLLPGPVLGNCSMSVTEGPYWRSLPRLIESEPANALVCSQLFINNQIWFFPEHNDFDPENGDLYPANLPYLVISQGSSYTDKPFVEAFAAALAAMPPVVKNQAAKRMILGGMLQSIFRHTLRNLKNDGDYLTGAAHPAVFNAGNLNAEAMAEMAHGLTEDDLVPMPVLRMVKETESAPGTDYFDIRNEKLMDSIMCIVRVVRNTAKTRKMTVQAHTFGGVTGEKTTFVWKLLRGDPEKVRIKPLTESGDRAELEVDYHGLYQPMSTDGTPENRKTRRVDIGCFVKTERSKRYSTPAMVCVYCQPSESRIYRPDGQIQYVDYTNQRHVYSDPILTIEKNWKDVYSYTKDGKPLGWHRLRGKHDDRFTYAGHRVTDTDELNRPVRACSVEYLPVHNGPNTIPPTLSYVDGNEVFEYSYTGVNDEIGTYRKQ